VRPAILLVVLAACADDPDPCAAITGTCVTVRVDGDVGPIDQLEVDVLYGDRHATTSTQADGGRAVSLPVVTAIAVDHDAALVVSIVVAGKLGGDTLGTGGAAAALDPGARATLDVLLTAPQACTAGGFYCGGDKVAGDPDVLYECNGGGVPLARGRCAGGCAVEPADDDTCRAAGGTCVDGGFYCGGDKLDGDPQTLYTCEGGVGIDGVECADGCVVAPAGQDDHCR
jgi:hypothetical protein